VTLIFRFVILKKRKVQIEPIGNDSALLQDLELKADKSAQ
jgi:hypothetical protein